MTRIPRQKPIDWNWVAIGLSGLLILASLAALVEVPPPPQVNHCAKPDTNNLWCLE